MTLASGRGASKPGRWASTPASSSSHCADFRDHDKIPAWRQQIIASGFLITAEQEITPHVLAALDADNDRKLALMQRILPKSLYSSFSDFAAVKGSLVYEHFRTGQMKYWRFELTRPGAI